MQPPRDVSRIVQPFARPAAHLVGSDRPSRSHFGGDPQLPLGIPWPVRDERPLTFLARLSLRELREEVFIDWLPGTEALLFFYDVEEMPWGFDPEDRGSWAVLRVPDLEEPVESRPEYRERAPAASLPFRGILVRPVGSYPSTEREPLESLDFTRAESEALLKLQSEQFEGMPRHKVGGYPDAVQNDTMELECQLASNELYCGDERGYEDSRAEDLRVGSADWRLLLQIDTDDELDAMWGDMGKIYFWVREQDARAGNFMSTWLVLQCS